ncbi:MAG: NUDIX domain-containing protein [Asticcacaulis sp.]
MAQIHECIAVIGRFSPFDNGHMAMIDRARAMASRVLFIVTAADMARACRYPFTATEREAMIRAAVGEGPDIAFIRGHAYDEDAWLIDADVVLPAMAAIMAVPADVPAERLRRLGRPQIDGGGPVLDRDTFLDAFYGDFPALEPKVPAAVFAWMSAFRETEPFQAVAAEQRYTIDYRQSWESAPYPVVFLTVDTLIIHPDPDSVPHILLIRRARIPGKGQWAMPGGFVEPGEWLRAAALRELREETGMGGTDEDLLSRLVATQVFDDPERASRGHVVTHAYHFEFPAGPLPPVKGGDDAEQALWLPLSDLPGLRGQFFEDHGSMIEFFLDAETR